MRMALGAAGTQVARLILKQSLGPVGIGLAGGSVLALAVAIVLMATPARVRSATRSMSWIPWRISRAPSSS